MTIIFLITKLNGETFAVDTIGQVRDHINVTPEWQVFQRFIDDEGATVTPVRFIPQEG